MINKNLADGEASPAQVLIVDDSRLSGRKIQMAVQALGHDSEVAVDGFEAMEKLQEHPFDLVILDIEMPGMDGYEVLKAIKAKDTLREIPVIVVSSLEDEVDQVARAISLGAEDFLPKSFDPKILRARIDTSLASKRHRDRQLDYFRDIERLTEAAKVIEQGAFRPVDLEVGLVADRSDALGQLATVFRRLAEEIYDRERRSDIKVRTLRGTLLVLMAGSLFSLAPALGRLASEQSIQPLGLVIWASLVAAFLCLSVSIWRSGLPRLSMRHFGFLLLWAIVVGCLYQLLTVIIAAHVEATLIALIGSTRGFMVFLLAALLALEPPSLRRFAGLGIGFFAIAALLLSNDPRWGENSTLWLYSALILPLLLSIHTLLMAWRPKDLDATTAVGIMMLLTALLLCPFAIGQDALFLPSPNPGKREIIIVVLGATTGAALVLALNLVALAGPVFASQMAYSQTLAGIAWGILLLGERLSLLASCSLALVILGFWLVEPKKAGNDFRVTLRMRGLRQN